jgi:hypothetical protein
MPKHKSHSDEIPAVDWIWGAEAIGREIGRTPEQIYYMFGKGLFRPNAAVWKMSHKLLVGSRQKLRELPALLAAAE